MRKQVWTLRVKRNPVKIIIIKRTADYMAHLQGNPGVWGCGLTPSRAIGDLVFFHPEAFGIQIDPTPERLGR